MTIVIGILTEPILHWMNTPEETFSYAYLYIFIDNTMGFSLIIKV